MSRSYLRETVAPCRRGRTAGAGMARELLWIFSAVGTGWNLAD
ncbi:MULTISPECIES: hypothetical protein [Marinobacter]|nr:MULTISPECIES: hypothetical protein [Marinobacter]